MITEVSTRWRAGEGATPEDLALVTTTGRRGRRRRTGPSRPPPPRLRPPAMGWRSPPPGRSTPASFRSWKAPCSVWLSSGCPAERNPKPVWLWASATGASPADVDRWWRAFLRRFDLEHTFRLFKQTLGWTAPKIRGPRSADRWTWLVLAVYTQLRLARPLTTDLRRPWERPVPPARLTPARVRRGFRNLRRKTPMPARAPKPSRPGPGRPAGGTNPRRAIIQPVGKIQNRSTGASPEEQTG